MRFSFLAATIAASISFSAHAQNAQIPPVYPVQLFAELPTVRQIAISPDGEYMAFTSPIEGRMHVIIKPTSDKDYKNAVALPPIDEGRLTADVSWIRWANNERIFVAYRFTNDHAFDRYARTALFSVSRKDSSDWVDMAKPTREQRTHGYKLSPAQFKDRVLDFLPDDPEHVILSIDSDQDGRYEVRKVNVNDGNYSTITDGYKGIQNWLLDQNKEPRMGWGYDSSTRKAVYRNPENKKFMDLTKTDWQDSERIVPIDFTEDPRIAYALERTGDSDRRLVKFDVMDGKVTQILLERDDAVATGLRYHPDTGAIIGYTYADDEGSYTHFTEPFLNKLQKRIDELLPGGTNTLADFVPSKNFYVILHTNSRDEGTFYALDLKNKALVPMISRRTLPAAAMAETTVHDLTARDGLEFVTLLTTPVGRGAKDLPLIVMPHGGPHSNSDTDFDYMRQFFANRGYAVLEPNFRGSTGYGVSFREAGENQWGAKMQDDVTDATKWAIDEGIADPKRICIVGGSYGGYAALMGTIAEQGMYACAVSINGVADIPGLLQFDRKFLGGKEWNKKIVPAGMKPEQISPVHRATEVSAPVLIIHAKDDPVVRFDQGKDMYSKLKSLKKLVEFVEIKTGDHFLDTAEARLATLSAMETFLARHLGASAASR